LASKAAPHEFPQSNRFVVRRFDLRRVEFKNLENTITFFGKRSILLRLGVAPCRSVLQAMFSLAVAKFRTVRRPGRAVSIVRAIN
jgi:hypothetical protein